MIGRVIEQRDAITSVLLDKEMTTAVSMKKLLLSNDDWDYIADVKKILEPFDVATRIMSSESQSTIAMVRPTAHSIVKKFLQPKDDDSEEIHLLKDILEDELRTRFLKTTSVAVCGLACYLDPRYKDLRDESQPCRQKDKDALLEIISVENTHHEFQTSAKDQREKDLEYLFDPERGLSGDLERTLSFGNKTAIGKEIDKYDRELTIPKGDNPLLWWNSKRHKYPILATYARRYLVIPSSSTPSERVFSTAGNVISTKRSCLLPDNANLFIFLYQNREMIEETD
ncbi:E3 SUMO-protein ligase ZBED1-like [Neodiprion lecontei]|uniref:E3 SUMO-protein ligase ZBED1-like n=1 Tax=Neodiprion lecontei TaxID=441921 RepID=A0ABM3FQ08_NEOLC|nr:E3 SUMO-protein ligase ZBED1-like [Neodiprion lecontei]